MTDTDCEAAHVDEIDDVSDGFHTFRQLYYQRMMLFAAIVKQNKDKAWKSLRHEDGELCFGGGWFIVGIDTPKGSYTYHYENKYFDLFDCEILDYGKHWDGHTEKDVTRLLSLSPAQPEPCEGAMEDNHEERDRAKNKHAKARMIGKVIAGVLMLLSYVFVVSAFTIGACMLVVYFSGMIGWLAYLILATVTAVMVIAAIKGN